MQMLLLLFLLLKQKFTEAISLCKKEMGRYRYVMLAFPSCHWQDSILQRHPRFNVQLLGINLSPFSSPWGGDITYKLSNCTVIVCNYYCCCFYYSSSSSQKQSHYTKKRWADIDMSCLPSLHVTGRTWSWNGILYWMVGYWVSICRLPQLLEEVTLPTSFPTAL